MDTWVLVLIVVATGSHEPKSIATVPGYRSEAACKIAAGSMFDSKQYMDSMTFKCIPGPSR